MSPRPLPPRLRRALAAQALDRAVLGPRRDPILFVPFRVGTSIVAPWIASAIVIGTVTSRLPSSSRLKTGEGATRVTT